MKKITEDSAVAVNSAGSGGSVSGVGSNDDPTKPLAALLFKSFINKHPKQIMLDRIEGMKKDISGKNPNPLNNTFKNGNRELLPGTNDVLRKGLDDHRKKHEAKKLRDITK